MKHVSGVWGYQLMALLLQAVYLAISSRVVGQSEFGAYAVALSVMAVAGMIANAGLTNASARREDTATPGRRALVSAGLAVSCAAMLIVIASAPVWASMWGDVTAVGVIRVLAWILPTSTWCGIAGGFLRRDGRMRLYTIANSIGTMVGFVLGLTAVVLAQSAVSLAVMSLTTPTVSLIVMLLVSGPQARPGLDLRSIREDLGFGAKSSVVWAVATMSNTLPIIGLSRVLGAGQLGQWNRAQTLARLPWDTTLRSVNVVTYPLFRNPVPVSRPTLESWTAATAGIGLLAIPLALIPLPVLDVVVQLALGPQWQTTQEIVIWLWVAAAVSAMSFMLNSALESSGHFAGALLAQVAALIVTMLGLLGLATTGTWTPLAAAIILASAVAHLVQITSGSRLGLLQGGRILRWYLLAGALGALGWGGCWLLSTMVRPAWAQLLAGLLVAVIYLLGLAAFRNHLWPLRRLLT